MQRGTEAKVCWSALSCRSGCDSLTDSGRHTFAHASARVEELTAWALQGDDAGF
jgi:hypothetical protein